MQTVTAFPTARYAKAVEVSKRIAWDIDRDLIRGRSFDFAHKFLPDGLSLVDELAFLGADDQRRLSQVQGRTYANIFALVERFISAKVTEVSRDHWLGDQKAFEALVRFTNEELKHQEMFRRIDAMLDADMPAGYVNVPDPNAVAAVVLGKSTWSVLALTSFIELFVSAHYRSSIDPAPDLSPLWKDVFLYHWKDESQHVVIDELEWAREDARLGEAERDAAVGDLIDLVGAVDGILQAQAAADATYFAGITGGRYTAEQQQAVHDGILKAYRWQYIVSGAMEPRFQRQLAGMTNAAQLQRVHEALAPLAYAVPANPALPLPLAA
jgi:hypothetical protein